MAANLMHSLTDDAPDFQKQMGCMNGFFQFFDRYHILTSRKSASHNSLLPGSLNNGSMITGTNSMYDLQNSMEKKSNKNPNESHGDFSESSMVSFSSTCSPSSSLDCTKMTQLPDHSPLDIPNFPETPSQDPSRSSSCSHLGRPSLDLRDVVKGSMYRGSQKNSRLGESPYFSETSEFSRSSLLIPNDRHRFSCDGREMNRCSSESSRNRTVPRCSLDSREGFTRVSNSSSKLNVHKSPDQTAKRPPGVVAKLMGLEMLPNSPLASANIRGREEFGKSSSSPGPSSSVYSEIEKRLKGLQVQQSGNDLQALKQILEVMHNPGHISPKYRQSGHIVANSSRARESPIVVMKPAKQMKKSSTSNSSAIPINDVPGFHRTRDVEFLNIKRNGRQSSKASLVSSADKKINVRDSKSSQDSTRSIKGSSSVSPRLQKKKINPEKLAKPSVSSRPPIKFNRRATEPGSVELKSSILQQSDVLLNEVSNEESVQSGSKASMLKSCVDVQVTNVELSDCTRGTSIPDNATVKESGSDLNQEVQFPRLIGNGSPEKLATIEHLSPVSVLNISKDPADDNDTPSPVKHASRENLPCTVMSHAKLQSIENLIEKLKILSASYGETDTDYITSLCQNPNEDQRYISEIFLASGLLLRDYGSGLNTFQPHASGHPINPELFFVLEQTKSKYDPGQMKIRRKLVFDAVNEILVGKLKVLVLEPRAGYKVLARKAPNAQRLHREVCMEMERLLPMCNADGDDLSTGVLIDDVLGRSESWTDFHAHISEVVLFVERLVFRDLVDEIVYG